MCWEGKTYQIIYVLFVYFLKYYMHTENAVIFNVIFIMRMHWTQFGYGIVLSIFELASF